MPVKDAYVSALVEAYFQYDEERFRRCVLQIAAHAKDGPFKQGLISRSEFVRPMLTGAQQRFVDSVPSVEREALVLDPFLDESLRGVVREHRAHMELLLRGVEPRRRLLFQGDPGNGKTSAAAWLASELKAPCFSVSVPKLVGTHLGETAGNLHQLFPALSAGCCLVLDEIDAIGSRRGAAESGAMREFNLTVNALLSIMDGTPGGLLVATTNRAELLDPALVRRFDDTLTFPTPGAAERAELKRRLAERYKIEAFTEREDEGIRDAASFAEVERICRVAARREAVTEHGVKAEQ